MDTPMAMPIIAPSLRCVPLETCAEALCVIVGPDAEFPESVTVIVLAIEGSVLGMSVDAAKMLLLDKAYPEIVAVENVVVVADDDALGL
jgi:hypothetical protein